MSQVGTNWIMMASAEMPSPFAANCGKGASMCSFIPTVTQAQKIFTRLFETIIALIPPEEYLERISV